MTLIFPRLPDCELAIVCTVASMLGTIPAQKATVTQDATKKRRTQDCEKKREDLAWIVLPTRVLSIQVPLDVVCLPFVASKTSA